jgi:branched-chain amino acid aminotransferase
VTRGGRRLAFTENLPPYANAESISLASVTYSPTQILNGVKSLSYAANMQASRLAVARGADEALLVRPDGIVLEAPTSTIFWVTADGRLQTPSLDVGILASITRDRLVRELDVEEGSFKLDDLDGASEAFLASTVREVQAISAVNETELAECPGSRTQEAAEAFSAILDRELAASASR